MPKNIGFRITGAYFGAKDSATGAIRVDVPKDNPTVYDVMVEVVKKAAAGDIPGVDAFTFDPIFPSPNDSLNSVTVRYTEEAVPGKYAAGTYFLQEYDMCNPVYVFQYYIFDKDFVQKNNNGLTRRFNEAPDVPIVEGDTIVWRQLAIMQRPNGGPRVKSIASKAQATLVEVNKA